MNFTGKRVLVTGGTRGIGEAAVRAFLDAGARVAVNGASAKSVDQAFRRLNAGDRAVAVPGDLSRVDECERVVNEAVTALGGLDVLVNNAGVDGNKRFEETTADDWERIIAINLRAPSARAAGAPHFARQCRQH